MRRSINTNRSLAGCAARQASKAPPRVDVSDARKLKSLEDENTKLKNLLAEQILERAV